MGVTLIVLWIISLPMIQKVSLGTESDVSKLFLTFHNRPDTGSHSIMMGICFLSETILLPDSSRS